MTADEAGQPPGDEPMRSFTAEGRAWVARSVGHGAYGTGILGLAAVEAVHFFHADAPDRPVREALLARGRFPSLHDAELAALLAAATPVVSRPDR